MRLTCTSFSFPLLSLEDAAKAIALMRIPLMDLSAYEGWVHIQPHEIEANPQQQADRVRRAVEEAGLQGLADMITQFGVSFRDRPINTPDPATREANRQRFRAMLTFCKAAGIPGITVLPGVVWEDLGPDRSYELARAELTYMAQLAGDAGLRLSTEAHRESVVEPIDRAIQLVHEVPGLRLTLDYTHFVSAGVPVEEVHRLIPFAAHFHARQGAPGKLQADHWEGTLDYPDIVRRLKAAGYQGAITVEYTWQEWQGCHELDVLSESILLRDVLLAAIAEGEGPGAATTSPN